MYVLICLIEYELENMVKPSLHIQIKGRILVRVYTLYLTKRVVLTERYLFTCLSITEQIFRMLLKILQTVTTTDFFVFLSYLSNIH